jgi:hypothetical protein
MPPHNRIGCREQARYIADAAQRNTDTTPASRPGLSAWCKLNQQPAEPPSAKTSTFPKHLDRRENPFALLLYTSVQYLYGDDQANSRSAV